VPAELPPFARRKGATFLSTSEKYAIVDVGGNQHLVEEGRWYTCDRMKVSPGNVVAFGRVLALRTDGQFHLGAPYVEGATVEAEIVEHLKGPKVMIYKMIPKKHYRKKVGHRQPMTKFMITKISKE
jgi:ribosomal protein L21